MVCDPRDRTARAGVLLGLVFVVSIKSYVFIVSNSGWGPSYGFRTGITFGGLGASPGIVLAKTTGASPTSITGDGLPTVVELGNGIYQMLFDPEANGDAVIVLDAGSQLTLTGTLTPADQSATVAGSGTTFTSQCVVGRSLIFANDPGGEVYRIAAIASDTSLSISPNYQPRGNTVTAGAATQYTLPNYFDRYVAFDTARLDSRIDQAFTATGEVSLSPSPESIYGTVVSATTTSVTMSAAEGSAFNATSNAYANTAGPVRWLTFTGGSNVGLIVSITGSSVSGSNLTVTFAATAGVVAATAGDPVQID